MPGTYTVTVTTKNGLYSDTITINTIEKVNQIDLKISNNNFDGISNAFIYLSEGNQLEVDYEIIPESATNKEVIWTISNPEVAEVSSYGIITGKKIGKSMMTIQSKDGSASRSFNVWVYAGSRIIGDANNDGKVNIMDVIKLRRYLAGLGELE